MMLSYHLFLSPVSPAAEEAMRVLTSMGEFCLSKPFTRWSQGDMISVLRV